MKRKFFITIMLALFVVFSFSGQALAILPKWRILWIILPYVNANLSNGVNLQSSMNSSAVAKSREMSGRLERFIEEASNNAVDIEITVFTSNMNVTNLTEDSTFLYIGENNLPSDVRQEIARAEKAGTPYDLKTATVLIDSSKHVKFNSYFGLSIGTYCIIKFENNTALSSLSTNTTKYPEEVWIHEISHGFEYFYNSIGYKMPDIDGARKYGYDEINGSWTHFYRDNFRGQVRDYSTGSMIGIKPEMWILSPSYSNVLKIDSEHFPDSNFRSYVLNNLDSDRNGYLSDSEIANATEIDVTNKGISNLQGIKYFTNLRKLEAAYNNLTQIDVSNMSTLDFLRVDNNKITSLNVDNCTSLTLLSCGTNQLTSLNVKTCTALKELWCYKNKIADNLSLSSNEQLEIVICYDNQITRLNIGSNKLRELQCYNNLIYWLTMIASSPERIYCYNNKLAYLDLKTGGNISSNKNLTTVSCGSQTAHSLEVTKGSASQYQVDFGSRIGRKYANVTNVKGYKAGRTYNATYNSSTGIATFAIIPEKVTYDYQTGWSNKTMDVTIPITSNISEPHPDPNMSITGSYARNGMVDNTYN